MDVPRPANMSNAEKCERWRTAHPEKVAIARKRTTFQNRRSPILDPIPPRCLATPGAALDGSRRTPHQPLRKQ